MAAGFWLAEIAAIYLKGPVGPGIAFATAATLSIADRDVRWLRGVRPPAAAISDRELKSMAPRDALRQMVRDALLPRGDDCRLPKVVSP